MLDNLNKWGLIVAYEKNKEFLDKLARSVYSTLKEEYRGTNEKYLTLDICAIVLGKLLPISPMWKRIEEEAGLEHVRDTVVDELRYEAAYYIMSQMLYET